MNARVRLLAAVSVGVATACTGVRVPDRAPRFLANELLEQSRGSERMVPRGAVAAADPRSDLVLRFQPLAPTDEATGPTTAAPTDPLLVALHRAEELLRERDAVLREAARLDASDDTELAMMQRSSAMFGRSVVRLVTALGSLGFTDDELRATTQDRRPGETSGFPALIRMLQARYQREQDAFAQRRRLADEQTVTVQARIEPRGKQPKYLHVDGYDELSIGEMQPRYGGFLGVSRDELAALEQNLRTVESAAGMLRSIDGLGERLRARIDAMRDQLRTALAALLARARSQPESFVVALRAAMTKVAGDPAATTAQKQAANEALVALNQVFAVATAWQQLAAKATTLQALVTQPGGRLSDLIGAAGALRPAAAELFAAGTTLVEAVGKLPAALTTLTSQVVAAGGVVPAELAPLLAELEQALRPIGELTTLLQALLAADDARQGAIAAGATQVDSAIFQPLQRAPDARVRLGDTDIREGDRVHIEAIYRRKDATDAKDRVTEAWDVEVARFGFYPRVGAELIFARADTGTADAKSWKANAAAVAELHHRFRDPTAWGEFWNLVDPSLGVHLASLDQGTENVEFGLGLNASLFGGFVTAGYGWNLAADQDGDYWFVGIDLINVLGQAQGLLGGG